VTTYRFTPEEVALKLETARRLEDQGLAVGDVCRHLGVAELTYLRWHKKFAGLDAAGIARLRCLENDNARLRRALEEVGTLVAALAADVEGPWQPSYDWQPRAVSM
jgi:putative transposase